MDADEVLSLAAASGDAEVQDVLAARVAAVLNQDAAALEEIDSQLAVLVG